jgi:hypothetical protein
MPEIAGSSSSSSAGQAFVLSRIAFAIILRSPAGPGASPRTSTPMQLSCARLATSDACRALRMKMPKRLSDVSLPSSVAFACGESPT